EIGKRQSKVVRKSIDDLCAPALCRLPFENIAPDLPVHEEHLRVHRERSALSCRDDAGLQFSEPLDVALWWVGHRDDTIIHFCTSPTGPTNASMLFLSK